MKSVGMGGLRSGAREAAADALGAYVRKRAGGRMIT